MFTSKKAVFIDVDGTLTNDFPAWEKIHRKFGTEEQMEQHLTKFWYKDSPEEVDFYGWAVADLSIWIGRNYKDLMDALKTPILRDKTKEGIELLKQNNFDIVLVSGGIDEMVKIIAKKLDVDHFIANKIHHENGKINGELSFNVGSKRSVVNDFAIKRNYDLKNSAAIGDNLNDIEMFDSVGYSIALNPDKASVIEAANAYIHTNNFLMVVKELLKQIK